MRAPPSAAWLRGLVPALCVGLACGGKAQGYDGPWLNPQDITLRTPQLYVPPPQDSQVLRPRAHPLNDTVGWAYLTSHDTAAQINTWTRRNVERLGPLVERARETQGQVDGEGAMFWGPFDDPQGRALEWLVVAPVFDGHALELQVRAPGGDAWHTYLLVELSPGPMAQDGVALDGEPVRSGRLRIEAGLSATLPELGYHLYDTIRVFEGALELEFDVGAQAHVIDLHWDGFAAIDSGLEDGSFRALSSLSYRSDALGDGGAGSLAFDRVGEFQDLGFTGPAHDRMAVEMVWAGASSGQVGRARLSIDPQDPLLPGGDPVAGLLEIDECFGASGELVYRDVSPSYLEVQPDYAVGEASDCELDASAWPTPDAQP